MATQNLELFYKPTRHTASYVLHGAEQHRALYA